MISMEMVFLFILISMYMWNSNVCATDEYNSIDNVYKLNAKVVAKEIKGKIVDLNIYNGKVLLIFNVSTKDKKDENYVLLMSLADQYYNNGLRVLAFLCDQLNELQDLDDKALISVKEMSEHKIDVFENVKVNGEEAHSLWKYMKSVIPGESGESNVLLIFNLSMWSKRDNNYNSLLDLAQRYFIEGLRVLVFFV